MAEPPPHSEAPTVARCTWCSAVLLSPDAVECPSCGATLVRVDDEPVLPGLTAIDAEAVARAARLATRRPRSRLLSWLSGEYDEEPIPPQPEALAPPDPAVRAEMLRLELEARITELQAEQEALRSEAAAAEGDTGPVAAPDDHLAHLAAGDAARAEEAPTEDGPRT
jgi:hypothetical protein